MTIETILEWMDTNRFGLLLGLLLLCTFLLGVITGLSKAKRTVTAMQFRMLDNGIIELAAGPHEALDRFSVSPPGIWEGFRQ